MPRVVLVCCLATGCLLLAAPAAPAQPAVAAQPGPAPAVLLPADPAVTAASSADGPLPDPAAPGGGGPDRPAANASTPLNATASASLNATGAFGLGGGFGPGGGLGFFNPALLAIPTVSLAETWFPTQSVVGQPAHLGDLRTDLAASAPLYHDGGDVWALTLRTRNETFDTQAVLPHSTREFPGDLWAVTFGTTYAHTFDSGWVLGGSLNVGSASDQPFHSIHEITEGASAFLRVPSGDRDFWLFSINYSPTAEVAFPIPMVAYVYNPSNYLRVNIGLPAQVMYRPTEDLTLNFSYMLLRTVHAQASYRLCPWARAHVAFDWGNESYFLVDRPAVNDRLFYYDKRVSAGVLFALSKNLTLDVGGGYVFDRFYFEGAQYSDHINNELDVGAGAYLAVQARVRW
jgi:hypothetical protein